MLDLVVKDGVACGIVVRDMVTGQVTSHSAHAVLLCTGGYGNVFYLSTNAKYSNATAAWRAHRRGALFANPCYTQIHPTCIPASDEFQSKLTLMSESLRNDGRIWVPADPDDKRSPDQIPEDERDYFLERKYPSFGNLVPRDVASRNAKTVVDQGKGVGPLKNGVYLDFGAAIDRVGEDTIRERYGNLFDMYERITDENPYKVPMRIYPAVHYTMGGLWVDYNLMSNVPGLFVLGEANFSDHGANRLGASALMQGLADGYFVISYTLGQLPGRAARYGARPHRRRRLRPGREVGRRHGGPAAVDQGHQVGRPLPPRARQDHVGALRHGPQPGRAREGARRDPGPARGVLEGRPGARRVRPSTSPSRRRPASPTSSSWASSWSAMRCTARSRAAATSARRARPRRARRCATTSTSPTCGAWEWTGKGSDPVLHSEHLEFDYVKLTQRSYK